MRQMLAEAGVEGVEVCSAGTFGLVGEPAHDQSIAAARQKGASLADFISQGVSRELIANTDLIICMETAHMEELTDLFPDAASRMMLITSGRDGRGGGDIPDPIGSDGDAYDASLRAIDEALVDLLPLIRSRA
jgi:protein-tyrosine phosphatase